MNFNAVELEVLLGAEGEWMMGKDAEKEMNVRWENFVKAYYLMQERNNTLLKRLTRNDSESD